MSAMNLRGGGHARLTWHRGSVLPFASLWLTLQRVAALNGPGWWGATGAPDKGITNASTARPILARGAVHALVNERPSGRGPVVAIEDLATWLGEHPQAFRWSHLGHLPSSLRCLVHPSVRLCPACLAGGYHTALFSLVPMRRCPIHGCELLDGCGGGHPIDGWIDSQVLARHGQCGCGKVSFFTRQMCRRPGLDPALTDRLRPVAEWLDRIVQLTRPLAKGQAAGAHDQRFLAGLMPWCSALGVGYPECFDQPSQRTRASVIEVSTPIRSQGRMSEVDLQCAEHALASAFARHLRRHVAPGARRAGMALSSDPDPRRMAQAMQANPTSAAAFAMLVFAGLAERATARRWPHSLSTAQALWVREHPDGYRRSTQFVMQPGGNAWLASHAARLSIVWAWRQAQLSTLSALRSGVADWRHVDDGPRTEWVALTSADGQRVVSSPQIAAMDWTARRPDKAARRQAAAVAQAERHAQALRTCRAPALMWREDWQVVAGDEALPGRLDRRRLLGVQGRPCFWLYRGASGFVARACALPVQAVGPTPKAAIDALRATLAQYLRRFPTPDASEPEAAIERLTVVEGPFDRYAAHHWVDRYGFWRSAGRIHEWISARRTPWNGPMASAEGPQDAANRRIDTTSLET